MAPETHTCLENCGCKARIIKMESEQKEQWESMEKQRERVDSIFTRLNITLGGVVVACILLAINIAIKAL